jgi:hypothetical protein
MTGFFKESIFFLRNWFRMFRKQPLYIPNAQMEIKRSRPAQEQDQYSRDFGHDYLGVGPDLL